MKGDNPNRDMVGREDHDRLNDTSDHGAGGVNGSGDDARSSSSDRTDSTRHRRTHHHHVNRNRERELERGTLELQRARLATRATDTSRYPTKMSSSPHRGTMSMPRFRSIRGGRNSSMTLRGEYDILQRAHDLTTPDF